MKYLFLMAFASTFVGASCSTPTGLTRSCPGSTAQSAHYLAEGSCSPAVGIIDVTLGTSGTCTLEVTGPTAVGVPSSGMFNDLASQTSYDVAKGNFNLQDPTTGMATVEGNSLGCMSGAATAAGVITLACTLTVCSTVGEDLEPTCAPGPPCSITLTPVSADASLASPDASGSSGDAGTPGDASSQ